MENGDLIKFEDHSEGNNKDAPTIKICTEVEGSDEAPDFRRVLLTEIQYYRNPVFVPAYTHDDYFQESESDRYLHNISSSSDIFYVPDDRQRSGSTSSNDEPPPPLPPKRNKSRSESDLRQRLRDAGICVDELDGENLDIPEKSKKQSRPISADSLLCCSSELIQRELDKAIASNIDLLPTNIDKSEEQLFFNSTDDEKNPFLPFNEKQPLRRLTSEDILDLEGDDLQSIDITNIETRPKLPPRPPPPMNNRFSCPPSMSTGIVDLSEEHQNIFFSDGLVQKAEERNDEAIAFYAAVAEIRRDFGFVDQNTNPGYVSSPLVRNNALQHTVMEIQVFLEPFLEPKLVSVMTSSTANEVIAKCIAEFSGSYNPVDVISCQYVLKIVGFTMYLFGDTQLGDCSHAQECLKNGKKLKLSLVRTTHINVELSRDAVDDEDGVYFEKYFETPSFLAVSERGLYVLLDAYNKEAADLITKVTRTFQAQYVPDRLIQVVKAISNALAQIELLQIHEAVNILLDLKKSKKTHRSYTLSRETKRNYNEYMNPDYFDKGRFHQALSKLTNGVYSMIELYCKAFQTEFTLVQDVKKGRQQELIDVYERIDVRTLTDNFEIRLSSIHRLPADWKNRYEVLEMQIGIYYGGKLICPLKRSKQCRICIGFFEHVRFDELIEFDIPVKKIPREAKIAYVLYGFSTPKKGADGQQLGWFTYNAYDYQGFLLSGSQLFGFLFDIEFNPVATCATNYIQRKETVVVKVDLQIYYTEVIFPQPVLLRLNTVNSNEDYSSKELAYIKSKVMKKELPSLTVTDKKIIWKAKFALKDIPSALLYVLKSAPSWDSEIVLDIHAAISCWAKLSPNDALEFLQADYPDKTVRESAVVWLSEITDDDLCDYLPELVQALKYESYHNSALAHFLIRRALGNPRIAHFLFWHLKYYTGDVQFCQRFQIVLSGLLSVCGVRLRAQLLRQDELINGLAHVANRVKVEKDSVRTVVLQNELKNLNKKFEACFRLPIDPSIKVSHVIPAESSYFQSNTVPLKVAFKNVDPRGGDVNMIFKIGDDLRKDLVTQLMFGVMNKLWLNEGLDLNLMLYKVLPTGPITGLIEIVPSAATLREIHVQHGLTGSFKDDSLALWLQRFNSSEQQYHTAVQNFTSSAAGYCVATYLLGIGDRHNDNIMLTKNGHLFHIDFSKFMGELQKFGNINRDRVPFVLTPDMAYVINNGVTPTQNFQKFIELCCNAFNIIRRNKNLVLNLLGLMVYSGIQYLSCKEDLTYVYNALQLHLSDEEATMYFTRLIENSLSSRATQWNFFIHNLAQMKNGTETLLRSSRSSPMFSFSNKVHSVDEDGEVTSARVVDFQKRYIPEKHYVFVINITRKDHVGPRFIFRRFEDFQELHAKLCYVFNEYSGHILPLLPQKILLGRSQIREVSARRRRELDQYIVEIFKILSVRKSDTLYTFLHSYIKDVEEERRFAEFVTLLQEGRQSRVGGKIKLTMSYKKQQLHIFVMYASNLVPRRLQSLANPYVKMYLVPDPMKDTKRKTKVCRKSLNPTYNETLTYHLPLDVLQRRVLRVTVWDNDTLSGNEYLGGFNLYLSTFDITTKRTDWFNLVNI